MKVYEHLCAHFDITDSAEKCKGLVTYCLSKVAEMVEKFPSYNKGDYRQLVSDLAYFLENDDDTYSLSKVTEFTRKWRRREIESLDQFRRYHRKYLEIVGDAAGTTSLSDENFNRYFWEGIHKSLRRRLEDRMRLENPRLDVSVPFEVSDLVQTARELFDKRCFDRHLFKKSPRSSSDSDSEDEPEYRPRRARASSDSEDENYNESDHSYRSKTPSPRRMTPSPEPKSPPRRETHPKKSSDDEVSKLISKMNNLSLGQLRQVDPKQRAYLAEMLGKTVDAPRDKQPPSPIRQQTNGYPQRDPPPHRFANVPPRSFPERTDLYCFACGRTGHQMRQCGELNTLLNQGTVVRTPEGRIEWPDGTQIFREGNELLVQSINRMVKQSNIVKAHITGSEDDDDNDNDYKQQFIGIVREEDDVSSDEQDELGWSPGQISDCYALGAERNPRVSKDTRRQVQDSPPGRPQGMQKFPERRNAVGAGWQPPPINPSIHLNSYQPGPPKRITPLDIDKRKFEGKHDNQLLPMDVDQVPIEKPGHKAKQITTDHGRSESLKVPNPRPKSGRTSSEIAQEIMKMPLTVTVEEAVNISPSLRRDLTNASRQQREALPQVQEKTGKNEKIVLGSNLSWSLLLNCGRSKLGTP